MHLFFELGNGEYIAFFDQPETAQTEHFRNADSFDRHIAFEVADEAALRDVQRRINGKGVSCLGPVDHAFVQSVYMYAPTGLQVEFTPRTDMRPEERPVGTECVSTCSSWRSPSP